KLTLAPVGSVVTTTILAGQVMVGGVVSATTTVLVLFVAFPDASKAVSTTSLVPTDKVVLAGGFCVTVTELLQLSTAMMQLVPVKSGSAAWQLLLVVLKVRL